jgi:hypothetical protein
MIKAKLRLLWPQMQGMNDHSVEDWMMKRELWLQAYIDHRIDKVMEQIGKEEDLYSVGRGILGVTSYGAGAAVSAGT